MGSDCSVPYNISLNKKKRSKKIIRKQGKGVECCAEHSRGQGDHAIQFLDPVKYKRGTVATPRVFKYQIRHART